MATDAQFAANRRNAQKSTGPITPQGKKKTRLNALKHGLRATIPVLPGEDASALEDRRQAWIDAKTPSDAVELYLIENAVAASWALDRGRRLDAAAATAPPYRFQPDEARDDLAENPVQAAASFRQTTAGLSWMRDRWAQLARPWNQARSGTPPSSSCASGFWESGPTSSKSVTTRSSGGCWA